MKTNCQLRGQAGQRHQELDSKCLAPDTLVLDDAPVKEPLEKVGKLNVIEMHTRDEEVDPIAEMCDAERDVLFEFFESELETCEKKFDLTPAKMVKEII